MIRLYYILKNEEYVPINIHLNPKAIESYESRPAEQRGKYLVDIVTTSGLVYSTIMDNCQLIDLNHKVSFL